MLQGGTHNIKISKREIQLILQELEQKPENQLAN